jgi:phosphoglucosamine mutase
MSRELFGTDGVRGLAGHYPLDSTGAYSIGMAVGSLFAKPGQQIVIACDTRESSPQIVGDVVKGLNAVGVGAVIAGILPTPGLAYTTRQNDQFVAGIMVTASHNTYQYNGIKVFDSHGDKLMDATETKLNKLIKEGTPKRQAGDLHTEQDLTSSYEDFLVHSAPGLNLRGLKLAVDTANGAFSGIAARVLSRLGAEVIALFDSPDGRNINAGCGATDTAALAKRVVNDTLAMGIALDGDGDRVLLIDGQGREVKGDHILYMLAVSHHEKGVVATVMSNLGLELALQAHAITLTRTDVGDRYVLQGLQETGYKLGGEQSGHIIMPELLATGDGLLAAVQILQVLHNSHKNLTQWRDELTLLPQALVNIPLKHPATLKSPQVQAFIDSQTQQLVGKGRLLIRPSGTEPIARVMVEADNATEIAENIATGLTKVMKENPAGDTV